MRKTPEEIRQRKIDIRNLLIISFIAALAIALLSLIIARSFKSFISIFFISFFLIQLYFVIKELMKNTANIRKMEDVFPDFIELMSSNLRAGMTIDRALLLSSRKEFSPLDKEILLLGKDIVTGKEITSALQEMAGRIRSEKISKTVSIINTGIRSGGNLAILLEETAVNMRERGFVEKKASSNVLMYLIFIFFAITVGAPLLFSLSTVLVHVLSTILEGLPTAENIGVSIPFALTSINVSLTFVIYFSIIFLILIDTLSALLIGLISKGDERAGLKYLAPLIALSVTIFLVSRIFLLKYFADLGI